MNPTDLALLRSASLKVKHAEPWTLSDAEREAYSFYYGPRALDEVLTVKAADPPPKPRPPAAVPAASRAYVHKALEAYAGALAPRLKEAFTRAADDLRAQDARIKALEEQVLELRADQAARRELVP